MIPNVSSLRSEDSDSRYLHSFPTRRSSDLAYDYPLIIEKQLSINTDNNNNPSIHKINYSLKANEKYLQHLLLRSEEHTSELQSHVNLVCRLQLEKKKSAFANFAFCQLAAYY